MFKLIKELMNLRKSIEEKTKELNRLEKDINNISKTRREYKWHNQKEDGQKQEHI